MFYNINRVKNNTLKYKTYDTDEIIGIDIKEHDYYRKYRYKHTDTSKYPELMEIIFTDNLSLYRKIIGNGSIPAKIYYTPDEKSKDQPEIDKDSDFYQWLRQNVDIFKTEKEMENLKNDDFNRMILSHAFVGDSFKTVKYYIGQKEDPHVELLYTQGLPFSKGFKKSMRAKFSDCKELMTLIDNKTYTKKNLLQILYFYNHFCDK